MIDKTMLHTPLGGQNSEMEKNSFIINHDLRAFKNG